MSFLAICVPKYKHQANQYVYKIHNFKNSHNEHSVPILGNNIV